MRVVQKGHKYPESLQAAYFLSKMAYDLAPWELEPKYDSLGSAAKASVYGKTVGDLVS